MSLLQVQSEGYNETVENDLCRRKIKPTFFQFLDKFSLTIDKPVDFSHPPLRLHQLGHIAIVSDARRLHSLPPKDRPEHDKKLPRALAVAGAQQWIEIEGYKYSRAIAFMMTSEAS